MPNISTKHSSTSSPSPILFTTCQHFSPPCPLPGIKPTAGIRSTSPNFAFRCLLCDVSHRETQQAIILDTYNGSIHDQRGRLLIAAERKGTSREGRYDDEMVREGERRIRIWELRRGTEIATLWRGFLERWDGGTWFEGAALKERTLSLKLAVSSGGGYAVDGLPSGAVGHVVL